MGQKVLAAAGQKVQTALGTAGIQSFQIRQHQHAGEPSGAQACHGKHRNLAQAWKRREQQTHVGRQSGEQTDEQIGQHGVHHLPACLPALMGLHEQIVKRKIDAGTYQARAKHRGYQMHFAKQKLGH